MHVRYQSHGTVNQVGVGGSRPVHIGEQHSATQRDRTDARRVDALAIMLRRTSWTKAVPAFQSGGRLLDQDILYTAIIQLSKCLRFTFQSP